MTSAHDAAPAHDILAVALVGAARSGPATPITTSPVDELALPAVESQRALLLRAGAWATYRRAGRLPQTPAPESSTRAPAETRPACSASASALLATLLTQHTDLLPEALTRLDATGLRLPPRLLPLALDRTPTAQRPGLLAALGERGRWLARLNPAWGWAAEPLDDVELDEGQFQAQWEEGTLAQRVAALRWLRRSDPARARELLTAGWRREKAEARAALLAPLEINLAQADEPLLATALADRTEHVRFAAAELLARLPDSSFAQAERHHAASLLTYTHGKLDATPPNADAEWMGKVVLKSTKPLLLMRALEYVPPEYWEALYQMTPEALIAATTGGDLQGAILLGWTEAMVRFESARWVSPLWQAWTHEQVDINQTGMSPIERSAPLVAAAERDAYVLDLLANVSNGALIELRWGLERLPRPWSAAVASAFLAGLRAFVAGLTSESKETDPWDATLSLAALALPASHFARALEPFTLPESKRWEILSLKRNLEQFGATIELRVQIAKELPL